jgi:hypothetical protein
MIDIFEQYAPRWRSAVRAYARAVWNDEDDSDARADFNSRARLFSKRYRHARGNDAIKRTEWFLTPKAKEYLKIIV